jgi:glyoxylase-like metal-dependent hydrolase (beta-lactamase superfamily II)
MPALPAPLPGVSEQGGGGKGKPKVGGARRLRHDRPALEENPMSTWQVHAVKYSDRTARTRRESFLFDPNHDRPHPIDFFVWVLRRGEEVILVDTGFDQAEADRGAMPSTVRNPAAVLEPLGLTAAAITRVIVTHLHFDHAGGLHLFPNATLHLQAAEMAYATGPCMCEPSLGRTYTGAHVCEAVKRLFAGQVVFHDGDGEVA